MKYQILNIGSFIKTDSIGFLINSSIADINPPYDLPINQIIYSYKKAFNNKLHSIYIRGSVARGEAIQGFSDYDCFAVLTDDSTKQEITSLRQSADELMQKFNFISNFDFSFFHINDLLKNSDFEHWRFALKIQSLCIYGTSLISTLPNFKPNREIIFSLSHLEERMFKAKKKIYSLLDPGSTKYWCSWIMRTIVRCGLELVIEKEKKYTNQLSLCYNVFSSYYPSKSMQMSEALELAINPITNINEIISLIDDLGQWLVMERVKNYGL